MRSEIKEYQAVEEKVHHLLSVNFFHRILTSLQLASPLFAGILKP